MSTKGSNAKPSPSSTAKSKGAAVASSTVPRRQLGRHLRELRQSTGMTIAQVAHEIERGATTLQRLESGTADRIRLWDIEALCQVLGADETTTDALKGLAQQGNAVNWWHEYGDLIPKAFDVYIGLESAASTLTSFQEIVPGLFQTAGYAETLIRAGYPNDPASEITRRLEMKMHRQRLITRKSRPTTVHAVLDESALHRIVGSPVVMAQQLRHLADLGTRPNITLRILPYSAGVPLGELTSPFTIVDFEQDGKGKQEPSVVYVENYTGAMYLEQAGSVDRYRAAHDGLDRVALDVQPSRDLLRRVAKEYESER